MVAGGKKYLPVFIDILRRYRKMLKVREIRLYGHLGKKFGKKFNLAVKTPREAIKALSSQLVGFKEYLVKYNYHIFLDKLNIGEDELSLGTSVDVIKIVPETFGSGGFFKVILGVVLMIVAPASSSLLFSMGASMVLSGISEILFAPPKPKNNGSQEKVENLPSYVFNGAVNTVAQGNPVPLAYGKVLVGSQVISAGLTSREIAI